GGPGACAGGARGIGAARRGVERGRGDPRVSSPELDRLLAEIDEQPVIVQRVLERERQSVSQVAARIRQCEPSAIVLVARGSSDNAAVYGRYLFEVCNRRVTSLAAPSSLTLYGSGPQLDRTVVIGVSQS